jgi:hypothetical protein
MFVALLLTTPSLPETGSYHGFARMGRNKSRLGALIFPADQFKQPFESLSVAFMYAASNAPVVRSMGVLEDGMEHHAQTLLALSITSVFCLAAWIWARRRLIRFHAGVDSHDTV